MPTNQKSKVIIIGGGVIGLCSAYFAQRAGLKVTVVEKGAPTHDSCSLGNAGMVVPSHFTPLAAPGMVAMGLKMLWNPESPFYIRPRLNLDLARWGWRFMRSCNADHVRRSAPLLRDLSLESRQLFEWFAEEEGLEFGLKQLGLLALFQTESAFEEEKHTAARANELGIPAEILSPSDIPSVEPNVEIDALGAVYYSKDCQLSPNRFVAELTRRLMGSGVEFLWETEIVDWEKQAGRIGGIRTASGQLLEADRFVLAGGSWSPITARKLGLRLPMQAGKGYSVTVDPVTPLPKVCSLLMEARVAVTPMGSGLRVGGTMEIAGLDPTVNPRRVDGILKALPKYYPQLKKSSFENRPVWTGFRPCSPDGLPYLGKSNSWDNLIIATGHAMMGLSLAPITGKLVGDLLSGQPWPLWEFDLLDPERYG